MPTELWHWLFVWQVSGYDSDSKSTATATIQIQNPLHVTVDAQLHVPADAFRDITYARGC
jgi:hypothetical protein